MATTVSRKKYAATSHQSQVLDVKNYTKKLPHSPGQVVVFQGSAATIVKRIHYYYANSLPLNTTTHRCCVVLIEHEQNM